MGLGVRCADLTPRPLWIEFGAMNPDTGQWIIRPQNILRNAFAQFGDTVKARAIELLQSMINREIERLNKRAKKRKRKRL